MITKNGDALEIADSAGEKVHKSNQREYVIRSRRGQSQNEAQRGFSPAQIMLVSMKGDRGY
jgi:hypothetical protein